MKTVASIVIIINKKLPAAISLNNLTGEKASSKKLLLFDPIETNMNAKIEQTYNVTINLNANFKIFCKNIYT